MTYAGDRAIYDADGHIMSCPRTYAISLTRIFAIKFH